MHAGQHQHAGAADKTAPTASIHRVRAARASSSTGAYPAIESGASGTSCSRSASAIRISGRRGSFGSALSIHLIESGRLGSDLAWNRGTRHREVHPYSPGRRLFGRSGAPRGRPRLLRAVVLLHRNSPAHGLETCFYRRTRRSPAAREPCAAMHYQLPPAAEVKLVRCVRGRLWDCIVDLRPDSPTFRQWFGDELSAENRRMMYVPARVRARPPHPRGRHRGLLHGQQLLRPAGGARREVRTIRRSASTGRSRRPRSPPRTRAGRFSTRRSTASTACGASHEGPPTPAQFVHRPVVRARARRRGSRRHRHRCSLRPMPIRGCGSSARRRCGTSRRWCPRSRSDLPPS